VEWVKRIGRRGGDGGGWRDDLPLSEELFFDELTVDCSALELPIYPMFLVRLRVFLEWHMAAGRRLVLIAPAERNAASVLRTVASDEALSDLRLHSFPASGKSARVLLPVARLRDHHAVERAAETVRELVEYGQTDLARLGQASFMAIAELCANAIEHGRNGIGAFVAVQRVDGPRKEISVAVADLGIGIPEHLRQRFPEWADDSFVIGQAIEPRVSGTGDPHRGNGFTEIFETELSSNLHAARIEIYSARGAIRREMVGERRKVDPFPAPAFRRGTWISYTIVAPA